MAVSPLSVVWVDLWVGGRVPIGASRVGAPSGRETAHAQLVDMGDRVCFVQPPLLPTEPGRPSGQRGVSLVACFARSIVSRFLRKILNFIKPLSYGGYVITRGDLIRHH